MDAWPALPALKNISLVMLWSSPSAILSMMMLNW